VGKGNTTMTGWDWRRVALLPVYAFLLLAGFGLAFPPLATAAPRIDALASAHDCRLLIEPGVACQRITAGNGLWAGSQPEDLTVTIAQNPLLIEAHENLYWAESITAVPLPAAGWLILAGLGALGLARRRRQNSLPTLRSAAGIDCLEPLGAALRGSGASEGFTHRNRWGSWVTLPGFIGSRKRFQHLPYRPRAFGLADVSPAAPSGGAGCRCAGTAERAPPAADLGGQWMSAIALDGYDLASIPYAGRTRFSCVSVTGSFRPWTPQEKDGQKPAAPVGRHAGRPNDLGTEWPRCPAAPYQPAYPSSSGEWGNQCC
jgi:hypothetical protein